MVGGTSIVQAVIIATLIAWCTAYQDGGLYRRYDSDSSLDHHAHSLDDLAAHLSGYHNRRQLLAETPAERRQATEHLRQAPIVNKRTLPIVSHRTLPIVNHRTLPIVNHRAQTGRLDPVVKMRKFDEIDRSPIELGGRFGGSARNQ